MGDKTFYCSCGQDFEKWPLLEIHKQKCPTIKEIRGMEEDQNHDFKENKPPKVNQFKCDKCVKSFGTTKALTSHNYQVHPKPQKISRFECDKCDKAFNTSNRLWHHDYHVHPKYMHGCSTCGKTFKSKGTLNRHKVLHTGEKPFSCKICNKRFTQKGNMMSHLKTHREK